MDSIADLGRGESVGRLPSRRAFARRQPENALGEVAVRATLEERKRAVGQATHVVTARHGNLGELRQLDAEAGPPARHVVEERELQHVVGGEFGIGDFDRERGRVSIHREHEPRVLAIEFDRGLAGLDHGLVRAQAVEDPADRGGSVGSPSRSIAPETIRRSIARVIAT